MKASQLLRQIAMAAALVSVMLAASFRAFYPGYPGTVPWPATVPPALLLALALALVADADPDPTPGERRRLHTGAVAADTVSHLTVEPGGPGGTPYAGHTPRPEEHILLTPGEPAAPPAPGPRSGR
ncbi:hypothetical protein ACOQFV_31410 [Nocardiopsis changdeensis]|uniref:Uncharacterized protein n=1 Tax=Nocardiopsis changdeensis TaxID=2831969 RepID=A0ABX8BSY0_9ACTN|nr:MULTISPECIES: hypothetical protein [Nocardiopsis]QUX24805.1 hypothetical protein KGD84_11390 [Nocardiopsis changdeensis]QYX35191.1 hypothetical protein K1J57_20835 [Nocardiopsis sp. MT53]